MSTATIKPKRGTTKQWIDSKRVLEENEWGVEITETGKYILKIGDGVTDFEHLEAAISTPYFESLLDQMTTMHNEVMAFKNNMAEAANAANGAATKADAAATKAQAAAKACEGITIRQNTMIDDTLGKSYKLGVNNKKIYIEEV